MLTALTDMAPESIRAVARGGSYYVAGLAFAAAVVVLGLVLDRQRKGRHRRPGANMSEHDGKIAEDSEEADSGQDEPEQPQPSPEEVRRQRRQRAYKALLEAKGQLIVIPDGIIH